MRVERRRPLELFHSALEICVPEGRPVIENSWPIPYSEGVERGSRSKARSEAAALPASVPSAMSSGVIANRKVCLPVRWP